MNGFQIEHVLDLIDGNIDSNMEFLRPEILRYLMEHGDDLAREISEKGYGDVPTRIGSIRISKEDVEAAAA